MFKTLIESYNPLDKINVTQEAVDEQERMIINHLQNNQYVIIREKLYTIQNRSINYYGSNAESVFQELTNDISDFMAFQEALFNLMRKGEIMPIRIPNTYLSGSDEIRICYSENVGGGIHSGQKRLSIPIFVHDQFIRTPSLRIR